MVNDADKHERSSILQLLTPIEAMQKEIFAQMLQLVIDYCPPGASMQDLTTAMKSGARKSQ